MKSSFNLVLRMLSVPAELNSYNGLLHLSNYITSLCVERLSKILKLLL